MGNEITKQDIQALIRTQVMDEIIEVKQAEMAKIPFIGSKLIKFCKNLHLMRDEK